MSRAQSVWRRLRDAHNKSQGVRLSAEDVEVLMTTAVYEEVDEQIHFEEMNEELEENE